MPGPPGPPRIGHGGRRLIRLAPSTALGNGACARRAGTPSTTRPSGARSGGPEARGANLGLAEPGGSPDNVGLLMRAHRPRWTRPRRSVKALLAWQAALAGRRPPSGAAGGPGRAPRRRLRQRSSSRLATLEDWLQGRGSRELAPGPARRTGVLARLVEILPFDVTASGPHLSRLAASHVACARRRASARP